MKTRFLIVFILFFPVSSRAQWYPTNGPFGGKVNDLLYHGSNLYAATAYDRIFVSSNGGNSWTQLISGLWVPDFISLAATGNYLFAASVNGGIFVSTDTGATWANAMTGMTSWTIRFIATNGTTVFASDFAGDLYLSNNYGANWTLANNGVPNTNQKRSMSVLGSNIFLGTTNGVYRSINNGTSWVSINSGLSNLDVNSLTNDGVNLYAGTYGGGVFVSSNNGNSWSPVINGLSNLDIASVFSAGNYLYAGTFEGGVFVSSNGGASWSQSNNGVENPEVVTFEKIGTDVFLGTAGNGVYKTFDNGNTWDDVNANFAYARLTDMVTHNNMLFVGTEYSGIYRSTNNGNYWEAVNNGLDIAKVFDMASDGVNLYALVIPNGIYKSSDNGNSWTYSGLVNQGPYCMLIKDTNIFVGTINGVFLSTDDGSTWLPKNNGLTNLQIRSITSFGSDLYVGTITPSAKLYKSSDNGNSWNVVYNSPSVIEPLTALGNKLFTGINGDLSVSSDSGVTWTNIIPLIDVANFYNDGDTLYSLGGTLCYTPDTGITWIHSIAGLPTPSANYGFTRKANKLFVTTYLFGVYADSSIICSTTGSLTVNTCDSYTSPSGFHTWYTTGIYYDTITAVNGCDSIISINLTILPAATPDIVGDTALCSGGSTILSVSSPFNTYLWSTGETTQSITVNLPGIFTVVVTDANGCTGIDTHMLGSYNASFVTATPTGPVSFCQGDSIVLNASNSLSSYQWYRYNSIIAGATSENITVKIRGRYKCIAQNSAQCIDTSNIVIVRVPCIPPAENEERNQISEFNTDKLIYPNPTSGAFIIDSPPCRIRIFQPEGSLIFESESTGEPINLNLSGYANGIYFVSFHSETFYLTEKLLLIGF